MKDPPMASNVLQKSVFLLKKIVEVTDEKYQTFEVHVSEARLEVSLLLEMETWKFDEENRKGTNTWEFVSPSQSLAVRLTQTLLTWWKY